MLAQWEFFDACGINFLTHGDNFENSHRQKSVRLSSPSVNYEIITEIEVRISNSHLCSRSFRSWVFHVFGQPQGCAYFYFLRTYSYATCFAARCHVPCGQSPVLNKSGKTIKKGGLWLKYCNFISAEVNFVKRIFSLDCKAEKEKKVTFDIKRSFPLHLFCTADVQKMLLKTLISAVYKVFNL